MNDDVIAQVSLEILKIRQAVSCGQMRWNAVSLQISSMLGEAHCPLGQCHSSCKFRPILPDPLLLDLLEAVCEGRIDPVEVLGDGGPVAALSVRLGGGRECLGTCE